MYCKFDHIRSLRVHIILQLCLIFQFHYVCMSRRNAFYIILYLIICIFWRNANFHNLQCCFTFVKSDTLLEAQLSIVTNTVCQAAFNSYNTTTTPPTVSSLLSPYSHRVTYNLRAKGSRLYLIVFVQCLKLFFYLSWRKYYLANWSLSFTKSRLCLEKKVDWAVKINK